MICNNCTKDLKRSIVKMAGVPVNCLALSCENMIRDVDGNLISGCKYQKQEVLKTIEEWMCPNHEHPKVKQYDEMRKLREQKIE